MNTFCLSTAWPAAACGDIGGVRYLAVDPDPDAPLRLVQGAMRLDDPLALHLAYAPRMMAWLMFMPLSTLARRQVLQFGLGAGSLTRFCSQRLGLRTTVVELNPHVVLACRAGFGLPLEGERVTVRIQDAARVAADPAWAGRADVVQVDAFAPDAPAPALRGDGFHAHCRRLLTPDGCLVVNLFGRQARREEDLASLARVFGPGAVWHFEPTPEGNTVALALRDPRVAGAATRRRRAHLAQARWGLATGDWMESLRPCAGE